MDFQYSPRVRQLREQLGAFLDAHVVPRLQQWRDDVVTAEDALLIVDPLKELARQQGLWNLFLPSLRDDEPGTRLTNLEYAPLAEMMGRIHWSSEVFNCSAPDTGNMELLHLFGTDAQKDRWLRPLLRGEIRSAFAMSEPDVASSDATNITTSITRDGDSYVINGRKWFISNAAHPRCALYIVMGRTDPQQDAHHQQSMILVPAHTPGVEVIRNIEVLNHRSLEGHCEIVLRDVRVPASNLLGSEGSGFELAQARLGPGRIHHCMRSIGAAELALDLLVDRALERRAFGRYLHQHGTVADWIARSRIEIEQARLLVLKAAWMIDNLGSAAARKEIAMIKALVPTVLTNVVERSMQTYGAMGLSPDTPLVGCYVQGRALHIADGPDEVHLQSIARLEVKEGQQRRAAMAPFIGAPRRR